MAILGASVVILAIAIFFSVSLFVQNMELRHDMIDVAIAIRNNPYRFAGLSFHHDQPQPFIESMMMRDHTIRTQAQIVLGSCGAMFILIMISLFAEKKNKKDN